MAKKSLKKRILWGIVTAAAGFLVKKMVVRVIKGGSKKSPAKKKK